MTDLPPPPTLPDDDLVPPRKRGFWVAALFFGLVFVALAAFITVTAIQFYTPHIENSLIDFDVSPDGNSIVFTSASGELYTYGLLTHSVVRISPSGAGGATPRFAGDGKHIVFSGPKAGSRSWSIYEFDLEKGVLRLLTGDPGVMDTNPSYSRDGTQVVFVRASKEWPQTGLASPWDDWDVWAIDTDGRNLKRLTHESFKAADSPQFCDNDRRILFEAERHGPDVTPKLLVTRSSGQDAVKPFSTGRQNGSNALQPCVSRDQKLLVFLSDRDSPGALNMFVANPDGSDARALQVTTVARTNRRPVIGPDNKTFYFLAETETSGGYSLWATTLSGVTSQLADAGLFTDPYVWGFKRDVRTQAIINPKAPIKP